ncbi:MAG TPA: response regulator transcription factor [Longimicrobium sp.]|nr:response regulator transcription factor [Longimicrobium sp.]
MLRVLVIHRVRVYRDALATVLRHDPAFAEVRTAPSVPAAGEPLPEPAPDVVLLEVEARGGRARVQAAARAFPTARVVAVGPGEAPGEIVELVEAGAAGYVTPQQALEGLALTLVRVARGELACPPRVAGALGRRVAELAARHQPPGPLQRLTEREHEVLALVARGLSNKEIARRLSIRTLTVKNHVHNLLQKLELRRRGEAAALLRAATEPGPDG